MSAHGKKPETDREYYKRRLSDYGRKVFEVAASALSFYVVDFIIHVLLTLLHFSEHAQPGQLVHQTIRWVVAAAYLIFTIRLLLPDASGHLAETRDQLREHWKKPPRPRKKP